MRSIICFIGPTGTGKSVLAIKLAKTVDGEIVNCDSRQVYRYMDIGTAKSSKGELSQVRHHLIDIADPDEEISLSQYQKMAYKAIRDIQSRGKVPFLVGGTGQYFRAVIEGWEVPEVPPDLELRCRLEARATAGDTEGLYAELIKIDPEAARRIDRRNIRRVIRALEVFYIRGIPFSQLQVKKSPPFQSFIIGLTTPRQELYRTVDLRVDGMLTKGLVAEVQRLLESGYSPELPSMSGIGYKQIISYLQGKLLLDEAIKQIKFETHRYIRQQYAWFRLKDLNIHWFNIQDNVETDIIKIIIDELQNAF